MDLNFPLDKINGGTSQLNNLIKGWSNLHAQWYNFAPDIREVRPRTRICDSTYRGIHGAIDNAMSIWDKKWTE